MKVCSVLGAPSKIDWPEGHKLASKLGYKFPSFVKSPLSDVIPDASDDALDLLEKMFEYDPNRRLTAQQCLEHEFFEGIDVPKPTSRGNLFGMKPSMANKNNKIVSSKLMRMSSKKFELERKDSPFLSRTSESNVPKDDMTGKQIYKPVVSNMPGIKSEFGGGFYYRNKPAKSPGTSSSSASQSYKGPNRRTGKKFMPSIPNYQVHAKINANKVIEKQGTKDFGLYDNQERRPSKTGISMLKFNSKNQYSHSTDERPSFGLNQNSSAILNSGGLGGLDSGGLSKSGITKLGRYNI